MKELRQKLGSMEYDGLITGLNPTIRIAGRTVRKLSAAATLKRGTLLARSSIDGKLVVLGTTAAAPAVAASGDTPAVPAEVLTPDCILCDDTEVGTAEDAPVIVYAAGCFDPEKVTVAEDYSITQEDMDKLRGYSIVFKAATPAP